MQKPILITGPHRSGSTWVGRMIAAAPGVGYIHEPFNPSCRPGVCAAHTDRYFLHVYDDDPEVWREALKNTISFRYDISAEWEVKKSTKDLIRLARDLSRFEWHRWCNRRALIKDPIAIFSAEWVAKNFDAIVLMLIRHPAAFVSSLKRMNWVFPFHDLLDQPNLIQTYLAPFQDKIQDFADNKYDIIDQGSFVWCLFAHVIHQLINRHDDWILVRHEDLSLHPVKQFRRIYQILGLKFTDHVKKTILEYSKLDNSISIRHGEVHQLRRSSKRNIYRWKRRLSEREVDRIRKRVADLQYRFYSDSEWEWDLESL